MSQENVAVVQRFLRSSRRLRRGSRPTRPRIGC